MKKLVIALMAFALVITLAGCGGGGGGSSYHLDYGDKGAGLKDYGDGRDLTPIKKAYDGIKTELAKYSVSNDAEGKNRTAAIMYYISNKYSGGVYKHKNGETRDMREAKDVEKRLLELIGGKQFEGLLVLPVKTNDGCTATEATEQTTLHVDSLTLDGGTTLKNQDYTLPLKWKKEDNGEWKIVSGFDELAKNRNDR